MIFEPLRRYLRRAPGGLAADNAAEEPDGLRFDAGSAPAAEAPRHLKAATAAAVGASALILLLAVAWWLTELQTSRSAGRVVVIDVPPPVAGVRLSGDVAAPGGAGREDVARDAEGAGEGGIMAPAPQPALVEQGPYGLLPKIAPDGREPWQVYARPSDVRDTRPRIAIVITEIGLSTAASQEAIRRLPPEVTLSVDPYANEPDKWAPKARGAGHEIWLSLPLETDEFPFRDAGPMALLTNLSVEDNLERLQRVLGRCTGYVGVASAFGRRFEQDEASLRPVLEFINGRGLIYVGGDASEITLAPGTGDETKIPVITVDVW
ncbi:MAG: divergent polysaccharide deacetylase family protein, partial [Hyphomicrobium sp.]